MQLPSPQHVESLFVPGQSVITVQAAVDWVQRLGGLLPGRIHPPRMAGLILARLGRESSHYKNWAHCGIILFLQTLTEKIYRLNPPGSLFDESVVRNLFPDSTAGGRKLLVHRAIEKREVLRLKPGLYCRSALAFSCQPRVGALVSRPYSRSCFSGRERHDTAESLVQNAARNVRLLPHPVQKSQGGREVHKGRYKCVGIRRIALTSDRRSCIHPQGSHLGERRAWIPYRFTADRRG